MRILCASSLFCLAITGTALAAGPSLYATTPYPNYPPQATGYYTSPASPASLSPGQLPPPAMLSSVIRPVPMATMAQLENVPVPPAPTNTTPAAPGPSSPAATNATPNNNGQAYLNYWSPGESNGGCADGSCSAAAAPQGCAGGSCQLGRRSWDSGWYGSVSGLIMTRDRPNRRTLTTEYLNPVARRLDNRAAELDWQGGFEVTFGRYVSECLRWEAGYWMLGQQHDCDCISDPTGSLATTINLTDVAIGPDMASDFFEQSGAQGVYRENELHNIELNVYYRPCCFNSCGCGGAWAGHAERINRWDVEILAGLRYFQFDEFLRYGAAEDGAYFGEAGGSREAYMESDVKNHLIGFQIGALMDYQVTERWFLYARPKVGIYGNHMRHRFNVRRGDNGAFGENTLTGETYPVSSTKNDVSFLAEVDLGLRWEFAENWSAYTAYRAVAVTGIALSDEQIPEYLGDIYGVRDIDSNGDLIVHGLMVGLQWRF